MMKTVAVKIVILMLMASALSGCLLIPVNDGYSGDGDDRGREHHRDRHDDRGGRR